MSETNVSTASTAAASITARVVVLLALGGVAFAIGNYQPHRGGVAGAAAHQPTAAVGGAAAALAAAAAAGPSPDVQRTRATREARERTVLEATMGGFAPPLTESEKGQLRQALTTMQDTRRSLQAGVAPHPSPADLSVFSRKAMQARKEKEAAAVKILGPERGQHFLDAEREQENHERRAGSAAAVRSADGGLR